MSVLTGRTVAVLGLGRMGNNHLESYRMGGATILAASDIRTETREPFESEHKEARWYADWRELIEKEKPELLSVVTNGPSHAEIVIAAARANIPVIMCEKPMANSVDEAKQMNEACRASGSRLYVNFTLRAFPAFQELLTHTSSGVIGNIRLVSVMIGGARGLGCVGSHYVDLMRLLIKSEPVLVQGKLDKTGTPNPRGASFRDPGGIALYEFANGARGILEMYEDYSLPPYLTIVGEKGRITADVARNKWEIDVFENREWSSPVFSTGSETSLAEGTLTMLADAVKNGALVSTGEDGRAALEMILGIHASDAAGIPIQLPLNEEWRSLAVPMT